MEKSSRKTDKIKEVRVNKTAKFPYPMYKTMHRRREVATE